MMISSGLIDWNQVAGMVTAQSEQSSERSVKSDTHSAITLPLCS